MTLFKEKSKLNILENDVSNHKIKDWFSKWDRTIAAITGVVIFCAILTVVIVHVKVLNDDDDNNEQKDLSEEYNMVLPKIVHPAQQQSNMPRITGSCSLVPEYLVTVVCTEVAIEDLCDKIKNCVSESSVKQLQLIDIGYKNGRIEEGWLNCINLSLTKLKIQSSSYLTDIGRSAFNNAVFKSLNTLTLDTAIKNFRRDMFEGLSLTSLEIACQGNANFENNAFGIISQSLQILQLSNCLTQTGTNLVLPNITGASEELVALIQLDIHANNIRKITADSFTSALSLTTLYASGSSVVEVEAGAFDNLFLTTLDLSSNELKTLPEGIFNYAKKGIILKDNNFVCNCDLLWLKYMVEKQSDLFNPPMFNCFVDGKAVQFNDNVTFCSNDTTQAPTRSTEILTTTRSSSVSTTTTSKVTKISTTPTTLSTTSITPSPDAHVREIFCLKNTNATVNSDDIPKPLKVIDSKVIIRFNSSNSATYIYINGSSGSDLLWYKAEDKSDASCISNITEGSYIQIAPLDPNVIYIFCLMTSGKEYDSPFSCAPFIQNRTTEEFEPCLTWLSNDEMIPFISGICGSLFLVSLITGLIVFYCIRQHPSLIKGNKRVIIVESEAADAIVMPSTYYNDLNYRPPSLNSYSNGYLTPRCHSHIVYSPRPRSHLRTVSERTEFVVPSTSTGGRYKKGYYRQRVKLEQMPKLYEEHLYESPPPLPPNHPTRFICSDSLGRNYSRA